MCSTKQFVACHSNIMRNTKQFVAYTNELKLQQALKQANIKSLKKV